MHTPIKIPPIAIYAKTYALTTSQNDWENAFWLLVQWNESTAYFYDLKTFKDNLTALDSLVSAYRTEINSAPGSQELKSPRSTTTAFMILNCKIMKGPAYHLVQLSIS